jgi:uncharacterized Zn-binding protein involved in type VI secretion
MKRENLSLSILALFAMTAPALAQKQDLPGSVPGVIVGGSSDVKAGGQGAARKDDVTDQGQPIVQGSSNVFINGKPAVTTGDRTACGGVTAGGSANVFVNGKPLARTGDLTTGCPEAPGQRPPPDRR